MKMGADAIFYALVGYFLSRGDVGQDYSWYIVTTVLVSLAVNIYLGKWVSTVNAARTQAIMVRNEILLQYNFMPPMYRLFRLTTPNLQGKWKQSIEEIERDLLVGISLEDASDAAIKRVLDSIEATEFAEDGTIVSKPFGRASILRGDG